MSSDANTDISVLVVAFRSRETIAQCMSALERQSVPPAEILVLENGSPNGETVEAADLPAGVRLIESDENLGFAAGNNLLARKSSGSWLALLNPDAYAHSDWLEALTKAIATYSEVRLFGSTQFAADANGLLDGCGDVYHATGLAYRACYGRPISELPESGEVFAICGAALLIRRDLFEALGGFDEQFFCYNEDVDLAYRARLRGERCIQLREAAVDHLGYGSSGRRSEFATYHGARNRLWVFLRNTPGWLFPVLSPVHFGVTLLLWLSAARFGQFVTFGRAIRDGLSAWSDIMEQRRKLQASRTVPASRIASAFAWNPLRLLTRAADIRPYRPRR
jgi:N-acetylglucosaminyl-diphospho-decaprenol L-rhamnosyltransferase